MTHGIHLAVIILDVSTSISKTGQMVHTIALVVFVVWLWDARIARCVVALTVIWCEELYSGTVFQLVRGDSMPVVAAMVLALKSCDVFALAS